jgi:Cof subfamily protein (haloacid dehalogenase superfamily)
VIDWPGRRANRVKIEAGGGDQFAAAGWAGVQIGAFGYLGVALPAELAHKLRINRRSGKPKGPGFDRGFMRHFQAPGRLEDMYSSLPLNSPDEPASSDGLGSPDGIAAFPRPVRLVAIDMDGTLLPDFSAVVSERNQRALREAQRAGIVVAIATGRRQAFTAPLLENVGLRADTPLITSNGAVTRYFSGERVDFTHLDPAVARGLAGVLRGVGLIVFTLDKATKPDLIVEDLVKVQGRLAKWVESNRSSIQEVNPIENALGDDVNLIQGMAAGTIAEMIEAEQLLRECAWAGQFECIRTAYPGNDLSILDLLPKGVSKRSALERLADRLGIAQEETMAIGDNWNDEAMLDWAGVGVLMGNATEELQKMAKERGWVVGPTNSEDGVAFMVEAAIERIAAQVDARTDLASATV